jgi:hypothetical protein
MGGLRSQRNSPPCAKTCSPGGGMPTVKEVSHIGSMRGAARGRRVATEN